MSDTGMFTIFRISQSGLDRQIKKLEVISENIANAEKTVGADGQTYKRRVVVDKAQGGNQSTEFGQQLNMHLKRSSHKHLQHSNSPSLSPSRSYNRNRLEVVEVDGARLIFNPNHPLADEKGYVRMSNVNIIEEMIDMMAASRGYDANLNVMDAAKNMAKKALEI